MDEIQNKLVVLVGSGGRIGTVLRKQLLRTGYSVIGVRRTKVDQSELEKREFTLSMDAGHPDFPMRLAESIRQTNAEQIGLVWNARVLDNALANNDDTEFGRRFNSEAQLGVIACANCVTALVGNFESAFKSTVIVSSIYGLRGPRLALYEGNEKQAAGIQYGAIKAAQIHLAKELAARYGKSGLRINCISYGGVEGRTDEDFKARYASLCPAERMLNDEDLAGPVKFLLSHESSGVNGHNLVVDGGWSII